MLLKHVGRETPLVVVFISMCTGILACAGEYILMCFCIVFLLMLFRLSLAGHVALGIIIGYTVAYHAPRPVDIPEGEHLIQGRVESSGFIRGNFRIILNDVSIDESRIRGLVILTVLCHVRRLRKAVH